VPILKFLKYFTVFFMSITYPCAAFAADGPDPSTGPAVQNIQTESSTLQESSVEFNGDYFKGYVTDGIHIVTSPARWDASDWFTATLVTGVAAGLYENDVKIMKWVQDRRTTTMDDIGNNVTDLGHGKYTPALIGGLYLYGHIAGDGKARKTALLSVESFVLTGVFVQTLKYASRRHRPNTGDPYNTFDGPGRESKTSNASFPSGHASSAFAVATVIASEYDNAVVPPLAYGIATIAALNRVMHNAHWPSDTFVGAAIGYFTGKAIVASHRGKGDRLSLAPMMEESATGVVLTYTF
jgi:membrane-associated phospholipid phosphatase